MTDFKRYSDQALPTLCALAIGLAGAGIAWLIGMPAPFLTGPAIAVTLGGLAGLKLNIAHRLRDVVFVVLGCTMGQSVTPEVISAAVHWPVTFACLAAMLFAIIWLTQLMLTRFWGLDRTTGLLSASPGHLSYVLGLTEGVKADLPFVSIVQSIRVLTLTIFAPFAARLVDHVPQAMGAGRQPMSLAILAGVFIAAAIAGLILKRLKLPAAFLMGGLITSAILHGSDAVSGIVPPTLSTAGFIIMGSLIGTRFSGVTLAQLKRAFIAGLAVTAVAILLALAFGLLAAWLTGFSPIIVLMAFAPGGVETMSALAIILGLDPTFVGAHHVARLLMLTVIVPLFVIRRQKD